MLSEHTVNLLLSLVRSLRQKGSWCGETHIQKAAFFLNHLTGTTYFPFILYKHGPYSFPLRDTLETMRAYQFLGYQARASGYGPSIVPTSEQTAELSPNELTTITLLSERLGPLGVADLERYATALYFTKEKPVEAGERAPAINRVKPHISMSSAQEAVNWVDSLLTEAV